LRKALGVLILLLGSNTSESKIPHIFKHSPKFENPNPGAEASNDNDIFPIFFRNRYLS